ncbi:hypothetical protein RUND412_002118 [Rhizina undulata]
MASPSPSRRPSIDSSTALSSILSPTASQIDLTSYPPRTGSNGPPKARRGSTASSVISLNSSVGTALDWRTSKDFVGPGGPGAGNYSNSISSLLETPNARASTATRPKPGEIPPVTLSQIPKIKPSAFTPYLSIAPEYERYRRAKDLGLEEHIRLSNHQSAVDRGISPVPSIADSAIGPDNHLLRSVGGDTKDGSTSRKRGRRGSIAVTPLSTVPAVYFDENFHLENPRTFDVVSERSDVIRPIANASDGPLGSSAASAASQRKALATNAILQEKLSWYMDTVEVHLISSISTASSSFFAALGDLRDLHSEASASVQKIQSLRTELVRLDTEQAVKGLEIVRLRRRRDNIAKLQRAVQQVERVLSSVQSIERLLEAQEIENALTGVENTEKLISGHGPGELDLSAVKSIEAVTADLSHLRHRIGKAFEARFVDSLLTDLRVHVSRVPSIETLRRFAQSYQRDQYQRYITAKHQNNLHPPQLSASLPPEFLLLVEALRETLTSHLRGLQKARFVNNAVQAYRDAVIKEAKNHIRRNLPSEDDAESAMSGISTSRGVRSSHDKSMMLARALRNLGPHEAEDLLVRIYTGISELIRRLGSQQKLLLDITMRMGETGVGGMLSPRLEQIGFGSTTNGMDSSPTGPAGDSQINMDISDLISSAVEIAQSQIVKILRVRSEQVSRYSADWFLRYFVLNRLFSQECEALSVRAGSSLQSVVSAQIRDFFSLWQAGRLAVLSEMEKDRWAAKEFENSRQKGVDRIIESAMRDPEEWTKIGRLWEVREDASGTVQGDGENGEAEEKKTHAVVDDMKFILPESGLMALREMENYLRLLVVMPGMAREVAGGLLEFLKTFHSKTCQLILGAGATMSAGLKSITTKHLAMASQALSIIVSLIPYTRECIRRHSGASATTSTIMADFDKVKRMFQEHQSEIHSKLISIMSDRARLHVQTLKSMDWDRTWTEQGGNPDKYYMDVLCKETSVLHKVLSKHLPNRTLIEIMTPVFEDYRQRLVEGYAECRVGSEEGKARMIKDAETFRERLSRLEGCGNSAEIILDAARNKIVASGIRASNGIRESNGNGER